MPNRSDISTARHALNHARDELLRASSENWENEIAQLFAAQPQLESFSWTQYTPYFNDGDTCVFSVYCDEPAMRFAGVVFPGYDDPEEDISDEVQAAADIARAAIREVLNFYDSDFYLHMFEDHVEVTMTREGATTEGYSHD